MSLLRTVESRGDSEEAVITFDNLEHKELKRTDKMCGGCRFVSIVKGDSAQSSVIRSHR